MVTDRTYVPPEWAPQSAVWVGWPHIRGEWGSAFEGARDEIAAFVRAVAQVTPVRVACGSREADTSAWLTLDDLVASGQVQLHTVLAGDIWLRDTGPVLSRRGETSEALAFQFNGWGGKYVMPGDTHTAQAIASVERVPVSRFPFVLEGGAVDVDGDGRLLTTRHCLLNPNRNPDWNEADATRALEQAFGVDQVIWLDEGLINDHTDGHVDNIARFIGPGRVLCQMPSGEDDPNAETYVAIKRKLKDAGLEVHLIPSPGKITDEDGKPVPASHMNFLISNGTVFMPTYDADAVPALIAAFEKVLPDYKLITLPARHILSGGGAFHCTTQQVPEFEELKT
ncbi:MAG: agmatine deiminase family protein [Henriciella sp.]|nr:agmatine deiminase family protein [Henriciella sp.]